MFKQGICKIYHGALVPLTFAIENIHQKVLKRLEEKKGKPLTEKELKKYYSTFLNICDIAVCHNGESTKKYALVNPKKTDEDIQNEWINILTFNANHKEVLNRTKEGAIISLCDLISYVGKDFKDGVIKHLIDVNDPEYEALFIKMGLSKEQLDEWALGKYDKKTEIVRWVTRVLRDNLIENSKLIDGARMSEPLASLMHELISLNYHKVVIPGQRQINPVLRKNIGPLIDLCAKQLVENPDLSGIDLSTQSGKYLYQIIDNLKNQSISVQNIYAKIVLKGIENTINSDIDVFLNGDTTQETTNRYTRISEDLSELQKIAPITQNVRNTYVSSLIKEIYLSPEESKKLLEKRVKTKYPNASPEELQSLIEKNSYMRMDTLTESIAKLRVAIYLGESTNDFLLDVLESQGLLTNEERKLRYLSDTTGQNLEGSSILATIQKQQKERQEEDTPSI